MKKILSSIVLLFSLSVQAAPILITDGYIGADDHNSSGPRDVIGDVSKFGIDSMEVELVGSTLTIQINTLFGDNGLATFGSYTQTPQAHETANENGIGFGDLFLSSGGWNPFGGEAAAPHEDDDNSNGTLWDYGVALDNRWDKSSSASLYELNGGTNMLNAYMSDDYLNGATFRNGQEV